MWQQIFLLFLAVLQVLDIVLKWWLHIILHHSMDIVSLKIKNIEENTSSRTHSTNTSSTPLSNTSGASSMEY